VDVDSSGLDTATVGVVIVLLGVVLVPVAAELDEGSTSSGGTAMNASLSSSISVTSSDGR